MNMTRSLTADQYLVTHTVGPHQQGIRLDAFLKERYHRRSREQLKRAIGSGVVTVKREQGPHLSIGRLKSSSNLIPGDEVLVLTERRPEPRVSFDYRIVYEDDALFVIDKPPNLPVHPSGRYFFNTLLVHLKTQGHQAPLKSEHDFFLVHRIDKETSGLLVLAKTKEACSHLVRQFAERQTKKVYLAITRGICPETFSVDLALKRAPHSLISLKMAPAPESEGGQNAFTSFKRLGTWGSYSLVECQPKTGRQHQIRVHLEAAGYPILGDKLYGLPETEALRFYDRKNLSAEAEARLILPRHALHAASIQLIHPIREKMMEFKAPFPDDLQGFLDDQESSSSFL